LVGFIRALEGPHSIRILLFLNRQTRPIMTKDIMEALGIRNWTTATSILRKLERANLVSVEELNVGRYKSRARLWRIQSFGSKIAAALEDAQKSEKAAFEDNQPAGRPGIVDIQAQGEKLALLVHTVMKKAGEAEKAIPGLL
jgi:DNA-binding MarR family transcriptional regulator